MFIAEIFTGTQQPAPEKETSFFEDSGPQLVVLYPGRFQPFHLGHRDVFNALQGKFGRDNVYISTSNKTELPKSPFNFSDKLVFMTAAGVPVDRVLEQPSPYKLPPQFEPENTILIVAVGALDADRLRPGSYKKDGQPGYYQPFVSVDKCETADKHGYVIVAAERKKAITIGGKQYDVSHGTESRNLWNTIRTNPKQRAEYITQMFGRNDSDIGHVLDKITEDNGVPVPTDTISPIHGGINESVDDMFAPAGKVAQSVKQNVTRKISAKNRAGRQADTELQTIVDLAQQIFGSKYSSGTIGGGKVYRISLMTRGLEGYYHYGSLSSVTPTDKNILSKQKKQFYDTLTAHGVDTSRVDIKYHMGATLYTSVRIKMKPTELSEDDDMFALSKAQKVSQGLRKFAAELQSDMNAAHASWQQDKSWYGVEQEKIKFILFLADNFNNRSKVPYTLNYIARVLNGDSSVVEYYKKHAIWDADDYLKETMGNGFAELFDEYTGQLDEEAEDDMFAGSERVKSQVAQDRHPLSEYLTFEDYDHLMDEFDDTRINVHNEPELDAYLEQLYHSTTRLPVDSLFLDIVEEFVHGKYGKYGSEVPRRNEALFRDLNQAFRRTWTETKPNITVANLTQAMAKACVAAIQADDEDTDSMYESNDDMFASPFRVVHDVMDWQRTASRKFGTRGMHSLKLPDTIVFYVKQEDGAVKGAYYSPQPASDDTNIGTYNKNFNGNIEQYMKQDPHNPLNQLSEEDDMFSTGPSLAQKLGDVLLRYGDGVLMYADDLKTSKDPETRDYVSELLSKGAAFVRAGKAFDTKGLQAGIMEWVLIDRDTREEFYNYCREVEDWDAESIIKGHLGLSEDAAGVGVVSNSKDPRYVMATTGDQNDVTAETLPKEMKAYGLTGRKLPKAAK